MKSKILHLIFFFFLLISVQAQRANKGFAVSADNTGNNPSLWVNISEVDLKTGQVTRPLINNISTRFTLYDGLTKTQLTGPADKSNTMPLMQQSPIAKVIAAAAYDVRHNRLFFSPLQSPELRWIDLDDQNTNGVKIYTVTLPFKQPDLANEANNLTRMVIAADGFGYALTNDGNHLVRFSTGKKMTVTDLGALKDAGGNGAISVHNKSTSFGGDMIADAEGNLYLFSAYHYIFKVDVTQKTATLIGTIKNLPANYTTNGAAIDDDGNLIVSSAVVTDGYYSVDMNTWEATKLAAVSNTGGVSDLASSHFAFQKKQTLLPALLTSQLIKKIAVYPNPVTTTAFHISFENTETGRYMLQLTDAGGRISLQQQVTLQFSKQALEIKVPASFSKGIYLVNVVSAAGKSVYTDKLFVN